MMGEREEDAKIRAAPSDDYVIAAAYELLPVPTSHALFPSI